MQPGTKLPRKQLCTVCRKRFANVGVHKWVVHTRTEQDMQLAIQHRRERGRFKYGPDHHFFATVPVRHTGYREDLGHFVRSGWEANVARILRYKGVRYKYEAVTFRCGDLNYTPDFQITATLFWEVKGWHDQKSDVKLAAMAQHYPNIRIHLIDAEHYAVLRSKYKTLVAWEGR
jgi:hypothetical protein